MQKSVSLLALAALTFTAVPAAAQARITPYVGFLASGSIANGPFGFEVGNAGAPVFGAQIGLSLTKNIALVGNIGYADSQLEAGLPIIGGYSLADSKILMYDGGVQLRFPATTGSGTGIIPFIEGGAGGIRNEVTVGPVRTTSTNFALVAGAGVDLQLIDALGIRLMAKDHMSRFDYGEAIGIGAEGRRAHNWVLGIGLNLGR